MSASSGHAGSEAVAPKQVLTARVNAEAIQWITEEATRSGHSASKIVDDLIMEAIAVRRRTAGQPTAVDLDLLYRLIEQAVLGGTITTKAGPPHA